MVVHRLPGLPPKMILSALVNALSGPCHRLTSAQGAHGAREERTGPGRAPGPDVIMSWHSR